MYGWLGESIAAGATVVTANRRLARELRRHYDAMQLGEGRETWLTPPIFYQDDWLRRLADATVDPAERTLFLDGHAQSVLWENCLGRHATERPLGIGGVVRHAVHAWRLANDWRVTVGDISRSARTLDERLFARAAADYRNTLSRRRWTDGAGMIARVMSMATDGALRPPARIVRAGYDRVSPAVEALFASLAEAGSEVSEAPEAGCGGQCRIAAYDDPEAELRTAGAWARARLEDDPDARVGIVCSGLETDAERAARLVREGFVPGWQRGGAGWRGAVNVSYGRRLQSFPAIHVALLVLRWARGALDSRDIGLLLRSRLLGAPDSGGRSRLDLRLRRIPEREWRPVALVEALQSVDDGADVVAWFRAVRRIGAFASAGSRIAAPGTWAAAIDDLLRDVGWPGERTLDSNAYQLVTRWRELLNELARLAPVAPRMSLDQCVRRLMTMAAEIVFQPQTDAGLVQLMGPLEAAGMQFDHLWVSGLELRHWPPAASPSPLLARSLQRRFGMPDSTPDDTLAYAGTVLARLVDSAPDVTLSWARADKDVALAASPLLERLDAEMVAPPPDPHWYARSLRAAGPAVIVREDPAPPVSTDEEIVGGAYTVHRQASEPMSAFAYGRLRVRVLQPFAPGLSALMRGSLVHRILHRLYAEKPTREDIRKWLASDVATRLEQAIDAALGRYRRVADPRQQRLLSLEKARLRRMLGAFLRAECDRDEFSVEAVEQDLSICRHGVELHLRVDRMDRLSDGTLLIIDYKTGATKGLLDRDGEPANLQLVVYASAVDEPVGGLALFNVDSRAIVYRGTGGFEQGAVRDDDWEERLDSWRKQVDEAIRQLSLGDLRVDVKQSAEEGRALGLLTRLEALRHGR